MYKFISTIIYIFLRIFKVVKVKGNHHIPKNTGFIVTCTHIGWVDVIILAIALYPTPVHFMAKKELFEGRWKNKFLRSIHAFPVNRENPGPSTIKTPLKLLRAQQCVGIFPSGTRTSEDVPLKRGAVTIAVKAKAPILPAHYEGPTNFSQLLKGRKAIITFGEPLIFSGTAKKDNAIDEGIHRLELKMKGLEDEVKASLKKQLPG
ncbi:MAG: lysophospholipid acyltransferase family protein [Cytobacillus gottheilii]|uniref:lysophospholipid acyltransferase family protein n=1 Tax=Cytobacillus gottheilii TaxID=859144 RepID=UPI000831BFA3|nr:lysophospholipid acyltransferase family protein [Cytobacillus gottheilii]